MNSPKKNCKELKGEIYISTQGVCDTFGITRRTLGNWERNGLAKEERGWWELENLIKFRALGNTSNVSGKEKSLTERKLIAEVNYKEAQGELTRIKNDITMGKYLESYYVEAELKRFFIIFKRAAMGIPRKLSVKFAAMIETDEARKLEKECADIVNESLTQMSVGDVFNAEKISNS